MNPNQLGRYEILGELGKGAMGVVYLAQDPLIGRKLALKTFRLGYSAGDQELEQFRARFLREAQSAGILSHPNIVTIHDVVEGADGAFFIAMEYVKGTDLKQVMQRQEQLAVPFVIDVVAQIAGALDYAHSKGVVHRDIKPANIIITADKQVKITDFGIARVDASNLTVEGQLLGTPNYMAPEQVQGLDVDHRADLFSLGVMLYEMLTRHKPFQGDNLTVVTHRIVHDAFTPPQRYGAEVPPELMAVLDRALRKMPEERYGSGKEMARDLRGLLEPKRPAAPAAAPASAGSFLPELNLSPAPNQSPVTASPVPATPTVAPTPATTIPPRPQPPEGTRPATSRPPLKRLVILAGLVTVLALGLGLAARQALVEDEVVDRLSAEDDQRRKYLPFVQRGRQLMEDGEPAAALEEFQKALAIVPDNQQLRRLRDEANQQVLATDGLDSEQVYVAERLSQAEEALADNQYQRAIRLAGEVLEVDPKNSQAERIASQARQTVERKRRIQERFGSSSGRGTSSEPPRTESSTTPVEVQAEAQLNIDFYSEISEGILTIYYASEPEPLIKENFKFVERGGLLKRSRKKDGRLQAVRTVSSGTASLKVYVYSKGISTPSVTLEAELPPNSTRTLNITLSETGRLEAKVE